MPEDDYHYENDDSIRVVYHEQLAPLETLMEEVRRPGDFYVSGALEIPMPRVEVKGVGPFSFPVPETQIKALIARCSRAPYGRGEETVLDTSVRNVWQLPAENVTFGGKSWAANFQALLGKVTRGLGCGDTPVTAELYKLLVYEAGGFFLAHRDTEKTPGMFGTLVVALPCPHRGGELVIRHAGREAVVDLCGGGEISELTYAAFYADCEHEVRPVTEGNRVCLVYNLIQRTNPKRGLLEAPRQDTETRRAARLLEKAFTGKDAPLKLGWLLEHQYSAAELSFAALKNTDAARAGLLCRAAARAGCVAHLAIVHIEEQGPAEAHYDTDYHYGYARRYDDDGNEEEADEFEVIEVSSWQHHASGWVDTEDRPVDFGEIPLEDGELLPRGALDGEKPDKQRLLEASGNEGCSFERSYRRAALMLWRADRTAEVLLRAGVAAALPLLKDRVHAAGALPADPATRREAAALAGRVITEWHSRTHYGYRPPAGPEERIQMLRLLGALEEPAELERFLEEVLIKDYDGSENETLVSVCSAVLSAARAGELFSGLFTAKMSRLPASCVHLLDRFADFTAEDPGGDWPRALREMVEAVVNRLDRVSAPPVRRAAPQQQRWEPVSEKPLEYADAAMVHALAGVLLDLDAGDAAGRAAEILLAKSGVFDPVGVLVPALLILRRERGEEAAGHPFFTTLWRHCAGFLLERSAAPPAPPADWRQPGDFRPGNDDERELQAFLRNPLEQIHHFRMNQTRRRSLEGFILRLDLDLSLSTDVHTRPQTLVCTKTRRTAERRAAQYEEDVRAMDSLLTLPGPEEWRDRLERAIAARDHLRL